MIEKFTIELTRRELALLLDTSAIGKATIDRDLELCKNLMRIYHAHNFSFEEKVSFSEKMSEQIELYTQT